MPKASAFATSSSIIGLVIFGTISSLLSKIVYQLHGTGREGEEKLFRKPWANTAFMFFGMVFCLPLGAFSEWVKGRLHREGPETEGAEPLLQGEGQRGESQAEPKSKTPWKDFLLVSVPTIFDLTATLLMNIGLLYVTASVYQMLRGAEMLFSSLFAVSFLHRKLNRLHLGGIICCLVGIISVGASSWLEGEDETSGISAGQVTLGMSLILLAQAVQAAQVTVEDYVMSDIGIEPLKVVGYEGVFGVLMMAVVFLPAVQFLPGEDGVGMHEDSIDTWHLITHSLPWYAIPLVLTASILAILIYNIAGMFVTGQIGAVSRTVLECARTLFVWLADLLLYYTLSTKIGEPWTKSSPLQAIGFGILVAGTLVYSKGDYREEKLEKERVKHLPPIPEPKFAPIWRNTFTIAHFSRTNVHARRWRLAANHIIAAQRLHEAADPTWTHHSPGVADVAGRAAHAATGGHSAGSAGNV